MEYPKTLYLRGWDDLEANKLVHGEDEEREARKAGYKAMAEFGASDAGAAVEPKKRGRKPKAVSDGDQ